MCSCFGVRFEVEEHLRVGEGLVLEKNERGVVDVKEVVVCGVGRGGDGRWLRRRRREAMSDV